MMALSFASCQKNDTKHCPTINLDEAQVVNENTIFSKVEVIPLQNKGDIILPNASQMVVSDKYFFVKDSKNIIYVYTKEGILVSNSLRKIGNGSGEYSIVTAFGFNRYTNSIEILTPKHLLSYDIRFNLIKKVQLPTKTSNTGKGMLFFGQIYDLSAERHILIPTSISEDNYKMLVFNSSTLKVEKELDYSDDFIAGINMQEQSFFEKSKSEIGIVPPFVTKFLYTFDIKSLSLSKAYRIENEKTGLQISDLKENGNSEEELQRYLLNTEKEIPVTKLETLKNISFLIKKGNDLRKWFLLFYDKSSGKIGKINCFSNKKMIFPIVKNADDTSLFAVVEKKELLEIVSHLEKVNIVISLQSIDDSDYYIIKYTFK